MRKALVEPQPKPPKSRRWSATEWLTVIGFTIAVLGFLGYTNFNSLLPVWSLDSALVGQWQATDIPWHIQFQVGGRCVMSTVFSPKACRYRLDGNMLLIDTQDGQHFKTTATMPSHDRLDLTDADGSVRRFDRAD